MMVRAAGNGLLAHAPAKVNLFFELLAKRNDGFHEIETLMCPIRLFDTLHFAPTADSAIQFACRWADGLTPAGHASADIPTDASNLVVRAVELLRAEAGAERGARIHLIKRIPAEAGLGGGSSDAAAALALANQAWHLNWPRERLIELAGRLGSDVPFFLLSSAAVCRGRGERITPEPIRARWHLVVVRPPEGLSTAAVYRACRVPEQPRSLAPLRAALAAGDLASVCRHLHNRLQETAETLSPWVVRLRDEMQRADCLAHQMSGSGTAYFAVCRTAPQAQRLARRLRARQLGQVYATAT